MRALLVLTSTLVLQLVPVGPPPATVPLLSCRATITGGAGIINGTYPCISRVVFDSTKQTMLFTLTLTPPGSGSAVRITASLSAPQAVPQGGTFTLGTGKTTGDTTLKETAGRTAPVWAAAKSTTSPLIGQSSLRLDDLGTTPATPGTLVYLSPSGSLSATMEPQSGTTANGEVTLQIDFTPQT
jgi:hypothetical protein